MKDGRVMFLPWQKLFLPGQWKKTGKTMVKTSKKSGFPIAFTMFQYHSCIT